MAGGAGASGRPDRFGSVLIGGRRVGRVGLSTAGLRATGMWGEPARRSAMVKTIQRAVELGVELIEVPAPFGPWADLVREAEPEGVVLALRLTGSDPVNDLEQARRRLGRFVAPLVGLVLTEPRLLGDLAGVDSGLAVGAVVDSRTSPALLGPVQALQGHYPPLRRTIEWCEKQGVPYLCPDTRILAAGRQTVALLEPTSRAEIERLWKEAGATPPAAGPG